MKKVTVCITGGHLTPAIAVMEEIKRKNPLWKLFFIGRSHAFEGRISPAHEERLVKALGVPFHALMTGRQGSSMWKFPFGLLQSFFLLASYRPTVVLSFGGYIALPVAIGAWILRIPIITHEQTDHLGLANRIIARFARRVLLARESGVPLRRGLFDPPKRPTFPIDSKLPIIYITGGSTGAMSLNALIYPLITELTKTYTVIHQVGSGDKSKAPVAWGRYVVAEYFDTEDVAWIYAHATLVIGRAGANTVAEVSALGLPALFIPLPWASGNEQMNNARGLEGEGMAVVVKQEELSSGALISQIEKIMEHIGEYKKSAEKVAKVYSRDGAERVVQVLQEVVLRGKTTSYEK